MQLCRVCLDAAQDGLRFLFLDDDTCNLQLQWLPTFLAKSSCIGRWHFKWGTVASPAEHRHGDRAGQARPGTAGSLDDDDDGDDNDDASDDFFYPVHRLISLLPKLGQVHINIDTSSSSQIAATMFYEPGKTPHNLPHDPFKACVVPRPIGWISTTSATSPAQHNLAPYSQFNNLTFDPPYVMFSANQTPDHHRKDSVVNAEQTGKFCWNLATWDLREKVNITAEQVPYGVDEFDRAGLTKCWSSKLPGDVVDATVDGKREQGKGNPVPMVAESPVRFECVYHSTLRLPGNPPMGSVDVVIGRVVGVHIADEVLTEGKLDVRKTQPIARCGYYEYAVVRETFDMVIPGMNEAILAGLEGSTSRHKALSPDGGGDGDGSGEAKQ